MSILVERIQRRLIKNNKNWLCVIVGPTGSGKSYSALTLASKIDPTFDITKVVFTSEAFLKLINDPKKLKKGSVVVFDEFGVGMPRREWYSVSNKMISYLLQTFRNRNLGVIFTVPSLDYIDTQALRLMHTKIITLSIDRQINEVVCKWFDLDFNPRRGKEPYTKYPRIRDKKGRIIILDRIGFPMPDSKLVSAYERKKTKYTKELNLELEDSLRELKEKTKKKDVRSIEQLSKELTGIMKKRKIETVRIQDVCVILGVNERKSAKVKAHMSLTQ